MKIEQRMIAFEDSSTLQMHKFFSKRNGMLWNAMECYDSILYSQKGTEE